MIKAFFQKWFTKKAVDPKPELTVFSALRETNKALDGLIASQQRMFEATALAAQLNEMAAFSKTEDFQVMVQTNKAELVAFLDRADSILAKMKKL